MNNKIIKVGCSALCGSLATIASAQAGDMNVTGSADATWVSSSTNVSGNPIGINSALTFKGSGELDNGWTFDYTIANLDASAFSSAAVGITMGGFGSINLNQGDSGNGIAAYDDKMPSAWEEAWGAGLSTGVRLAVGGSASTNIQYKTPTLAGITLAVMHAPSYGVADTGDKATGNNNTHWDNATDVTLNINPSLGTEILSGLNIFAGASQIGSHGQTSGISDKYEAVGGVTYSLGPLSFGYQVSGDYTGEDDNNLASSPGDYNVYKNHAYGVAFNFNDNLSMSYGKWEARKSGYTNSETTQLNENDRTIFVNSFQVAYTMGGATVRVAQTEVENALWNTASDAEATTISLGMAF
jgi:outer membrane protein OmpU